MTKSSTPAKSPSDVAAFVQSRNAARFPDSTPPFFKAKQSEESGIVFEGFHENSPLPLSLDAIAESKAEGRLITPRRMNPHD